MQRSDPAGGGGARPDNVGGGVLRCEVPLATDQRDEQFSLRVIGHDLRTPLAAMRAIVEYLLDPEIDEERDPVFLHQLHDQIINMSMMLDNLLELAQMDHSRQQPAECWSRFSLRKVAEDAADAVRPLVDHANVTIEIDVQPSDLHMYGECIGIERLIMNLLHNAYKHTKAGVIFVSICEHNDMIIIVVSDTGEGIPAAKGSPFGRQRVIAQEGRAQADKAGSGLGLQICSDVIQAHNGRMHIASAAGQGTQVTVELYANSKTLKA